MRHHLIFLAALAAFCLSCGRSVPVVEEGVSLPLAGYRSRMISDLRYELEFRIPETLGERVSGRETVSFLLSQRTSLQLDFRAAPEAVLDLKVNGTSCSIDVRCEHLVLDKRLLRKGENTVEVEFLSGDRSLNRNEDYLYTLFVPDRARTVFPCFDQPDLKGRFTLTLDLPAAWEAVANGSLLSEERMGERKRVSFRQTAPLSTYLFAFAAGRWRKETRDRKGESMSVYFRETDPAKTAQLDEIFSLVSQSLDWMEEYTGISRPFEKYDFVIVPGFQFGGMEHPGAILYNEKRMFLGPAPTTAEQLSRVELIAHETSHLWFGDAVTMRWFNDVWTKEVFANYFAARMATPLFPEVNLPLRDFYSFNLPAYAEDRTEGTNPIRQDLPNLSDAGLIYGNIVYDKAPVVMRMLADLLGEDAFRDGIREYLRTFLYGNADWNELIAILDTRTSVDLKSWSRVWVEEKGMPILSGTVEGDTLRVRQEDPLGRGLVWPQQVTFSDGLMSSPVTVWSDAPEVSVPMKDYFLPLPDPGARSYGWFRLDTLTAKYAESRLPSLITPQAQLSLLATLYENVLRKQIPPEPFTETLGTLLRTTRDPLVCGAALSYIKTLSIHGPQAGSPVLEGLLRQAVSDTGLPKEIRLTAFRTLAGIFRSEESLSLMTAVFREGKGCQGIELSTRDYMTLSYELAIRCPDKYDDIAALQESRIENPDLLREFHFVFRAVAPDKESRDRLFTSLLEPENRAVEPWAASALSYLNHPLRQEEAVAYLYPGLEELQEVQRTGDIFFPKNWCTSLLQGHDSEAAAAEVKRFLADHPAFPSLLKAKLLQSADHLL